MADTIKTTLYAYKFNIGKPDDAKAWAELKARLVSECYRRFEALVMPGESHHREHIEPLDGQEITLELKHVFNNQWNTGPTATSGSGLRVFDWHQHYQPFNKDLKIGHWLEMTDEMREVRRNTMACGYCGHQERAQRGNVFCPECLGSEYLKSTELHLTRMKAADDDTDRAPLTGAEKGHLLPLYKEAQLHGGTARDKKQRQKQRQRIADEYRAAIRGATEEHDGMLWLMDRGWNLSNVIYYAHTHRFCFGWRQHIDPEIESKLLDLLCEFGFAYTVKCAGGRELVGEGAR